MILLFGHIGLIGGLILLIPILIYVLFEELFKKKVYEYISSDFNYAMQAYNLGYEVKKQRVDGVNWTQFNPNLKNHRDYIYKVVGISKEELDRR